MTDAMVMGMDFGSSIEFIQDELYDLYGRSRNGRRWLIQTGMSGKEVLAFLRSDSPKLPEHEHVWVWQLEPHANA